MSTASRNMPSAKPTSSAARQPGRVDALDEHAEEEHAEDRRRQVALHALQVLVQAARALDDRDPREADQHHHHGRDAADPHQLRLRRAGPELAVEVDREQRRAGVEDAGQRAHERGQQSGDDDAAHARSAARAAPSAETPPAPAAGSTWPSGPTSIDKPGDPGRSCASASAIMPGMMKMNTGSSLRKAAKMVPRRASRLVRRAERALHDVLVGAPVPEADDRRAEQHAEPRVVAVEVPRDAAGLLAPAPTCPRRPAGTSGFHRLNISGPSTVAQLAPAAERAAGRRPSAAASR